MMWGTVLALGILTGLTACGGAPPPATDVVLAQATALPRQSNEAPPLVARPTGPFVNDIAHFIDGAQISSTVEIAAVRGNRWTAEIVSILPYAESLSRAHIDASTDFDRIFLGAAAAGDHSQDMAVYEHRIDVKRVQAFIDLAIQESEPPGARLQIAGHSCARLNRKHLTGVACVASSTLLLVTLHPNPALLEALETSRGVSPLARDEAVHATILRPNQTLHLEDTSSVSTLGTLEISAKVPQGGGFDITAIAPSSAADADTSALEGLFKARIHDLHVGPLTVPVPPVTFESIDQNVVMKLSVSPDDLDLVTSVMKLTLPL